ncbi:hypothetical protein GCG21_03330 [Pseudactinotalea sp. HY160]|uniref:hypothetical protein n=1 Tax=Pseudactinotalea sp. HY160 TaxID=2654490 RepID=UPI00128B4FB3|nr:hypothetical protein [Pseudactinotalea sp. HY160]MPV49051.1 hypothetical protein [Pseudactinotalea sp. HY160]
MSITITDAEGFLMPPPVLGTDYGTELRWAAGPLIGGVDWVCEQLLGFSPLIELTKDLIGDWGLFESSAMAWTQVGLAVNTVGENYNRMASDRSSFWTGDAAEAYSSRLRSVAENFSSYEEGCAAMVETSNALRDLLTTSVELLYGILGWLGDWATRIAIEAAVPVFGWIAGAIDGAINTVVALDKFRKGIDAITKVVNFIERFSHVIEILTKVAAAIKTAATVATAAHNIRAATTARGATANAFGVA